MKLSLDEIFHRLQIRWIPHGFRGVATVEMYIQYMCMYGMHSSAMQCTHMDGDGTYIR